MLDYKIEKRDGTKEDFSINKLNKWFEWAKSKDIELESLLSQAISRCPNGVSTEDFHKAMIDACVDHKDDKYLKVAARLLIGSVWKKAFHNTLDIKFKGEYPSLKVYVDKVISLGLYEKTLFSDEEIEEIGKHIDHNKDLTYTYTTVKQISDKYLIQDRVNKKLYETPQFMFAGIAMAICQYQNPETRTKDAIKLYEYLSDLKINAPTPYMTNLRTSNKGIASCCVFFGGDTADSIEAANSITYKFTTANAGIGGCLQTRSAGDSVRQGQIKHLGKIPYYKYFEAATKSTKQQSRSGAVTMYYTCLDPEVIDLLKLKSVKTPEQKAVRNMDYALCFNKCFLDAVFNDEDWMLISCKDAPDLYEKFYSNDIIGFERLYNHYKTSSVNKTFVKAKQVANEFLINRQETGRVYAWFADNANSHTTFKDKIHSSNLCVAPDTLVLTKEGYIKISTLQDKTVDVWNGEEWSEVVIRKTGTDCELICVVVEDILTGKISNIEATPYHKWYDSSGKMLRTFQLEEGVCLLPWVTPEGVQVVQKVKYLVETDNEDTYCLTEPKRHMTVFNGILTGNCNEIDLPTAAFNSSFDLYKPYYESEAGEVAMCFLAAICAGRVKEDEYEDVAYYTLLLADTAIDIMDYPFKHVESTAKARRSVGIGLTNVAHAMALNMVSYGSKAGKQYAHSLAEMHSFYLHKASLRLAKEKGKADWMSKTKYTDGWLPIDTYSKQVDNVCAPNYKYDWESLRKEIVEFGGIRNSTLVAHMPCESSSGGSATTNGLYPIRDMKVVKKSGNNVNIFLAPDHDNPMISSFYDIAWDVKTKDMIEFYAVIQKFTCQGISADFYMDFTKQDKISLKEYLQYLEYSHRLGLKSWYYTNSKTITEIKDKEICESCSV